MLYDEISSARDIVDMWHVEESLAKSMLSVCHEVLCSSEEFSDGFETSEDEVDQDSSSYTCSSTSTDSSNSSDEKDDDSVFF